MKRITIHSHNINQNKIIVNYKTNMNLRVNKCIKYINYTNIS
jgi:hypothetical protein